MGVAGKTSCEFGVVERFDEVRQGTGTQRATHSGCIGLCTGDETVALQLGKEVDAGTVGQMNVEQDQVGVGVRSEGFARLRDRPRRRGDAETS